MTHRVFFETEGDWAEMERNGEFVEADTLTDLIPKLQAELEFGTYTIGMTYDQLAEELEENGYSIDPV